MICDGVAHEITNTSRQPRICAICGVTLAHQARFSGAMMVIVVGMRLGLTARQVGPATGFRKFDPNKFAFVSCPAAARGALREECVFSV